MEISHDSDARSEDREERQAGKPWAVSIRRREDPVPMRYVFVPRLNQRVENLAG